MLLVPAIVVVPAVVVEAQGFPSRRVRFQPIRAVRSHSRRLKVMGLVEN